MKTDVAVIGAGPIGLFSVFQAGMLGMKCQVFDILDKVGGQCVELYPKKPIYDIPAYPSIFAIDLIKQLKKQADSFSPTYHLGCLVEGIKKSCNDYFEIKTSLGLSYQAKVVLVCSGNGVIEPNKPDFLNLDIFEKNKKALYKVEDVEVFKNKNVVIAGGGDSAIDWVNIISKVAKKVFLVHRRGTFRCFNKSLEDAKASEKQGKVEFVVPYKITNLIGNAGELEKLELESMQAQKREINTDFLLMFFGLKMSVDNMRNWGINFDRNKIKVHPVTCKTNIEGIYAVGDIATYESKLKLILTGFSESANALHNAYFRVFNKPLRFQYSTNKGDPSNNAPV